MSATVAVMPENTDGYDAVRSTYPPLLNTAQVAELLDLNTRTVLAMANDGRLPASRLTDSRKFHFLLEDIISTLKAHRVVPEESGEQSVDADDTLGATPFLDS